MANNRITYATAQLSIKDNRADATDKILGVLPDGTLASGIAAGTGEIQFNESLSGVWPNPTGEFRIKTGANTIEYIRYGVWLDDQTVATLTRGAAGSTAQAHSSGDVGQYIGWEVPLGVQTVSIGTAFNTEDVFTLGQLDAYENVEGIPEIEVAVERVLDGTKPLWLTVTDPDFTTLKGRTADYKVDVALSVYPDSQDSAIGTPDSTVVASGSFISAWSVSMPTDGNFTESITLVANDKSWGLEEGTPSGYFPTSDSYDAAVVGSGVQRSEDFDRAASTLPGDVPATDHIQSVEVSVDITREDIFELGSKTPFFRAVAFPVTVTTTFETVSDKGDLVNALGNGRDNLVNRTIIINTKEGLTINLGTKNKLANVTFEGFDAGGGNGTVTYEYTNSNSLTVTHAGFADAFDTNSDNTHA
ncbi:MAG: hypothetical protein ACXADW_11460 [Candidatus Hodarchaeales archaeon]|jgi:hypothetical protein